MSDLVTGTLTETSSFEASYLAGASCIFSAKAQAASGVSSLSVNPTTPLTSRSGAVIVLAANTGVVSTLVTEPFFTYSTSTGSTRNPQYSANMATTVLQTSFAFVSSVAVHSMKTFFVVGWILECRPLMIGGKERTVPF